MGLLSNLCVLAITGKKVGCCCLVFVTYEVLERAKSSLNKRLNTDVHIVTIGSNWQPSNKSANKFGKNSQLGGRG